jgi:transposase
MADLNVFVNKNGGYFHKGRTYDYATKVRVASVFLDLIDDNGDNSPTVSVVARDAKVSWDYAKKVMHELQTTGSVIPPELLQQNRDRQFGVGTVLKLTTREEEFLLGLRIECPHRPNLDYIRKLYVLSGKIVSSSTISRWFKRRYEFKATFKKPNLVPLDKFRVENIARYVEFRERIAWFEDSTKFHFIDEKHLVNTDIYPNRVRGCPLTGRVDCIPVTGTFRDTYNLQCVISANPQKQYPLEYLLGTENGNSISFMAFIEYLLTRRWFNKGDVLILDNAAIHTGGESDYLSELLWSIQTEPGNPLNVAVIFLPTRSPELNPIELIFHVLSERIRSFYYNQLPAGAADQSVLMRTATVLNAMTTETIISCCEHCGYT